MPFRLNYLYKIEQLTPSIENGITFADLLRSLLHELIIEGFDKDTLYFVSKREVILREAFKDNKHLGLNEYQKIIFNEIQRQVKEFLKESQMKIER